MKTYPISVSMTPAFYDSEHMLLRAQLKCLSKQTNRDFDVWLIDPHYKKRKSVIPELASRFKLDIKHIPYRPNTRIGKAMDCAIFNAAFCYSQSPINVRYSCYRFVRPGFIEAIVKAPKGVNVDFYTLAVGPCVYEKEDKLPPKKHETVWNFESEDINWAAIPSGSGYNSSGRPNGNVKLSLGNWGTSADVDTGPIPVPMNLYGNIAWHRDQWLAINGTNEVITNCCHWEDLDFDFRANAAGQLVVRRTRLLYRLFHFYGNFSQRSNVEVDVPFTSPCLACCNLRANSGDWDYGGRLQTRIAAGEVKVYDQFQAWVCRKCFLSGAIYGSEGVEGYFREIQARGLIKAPILKAEMIGRNLQRLSEMMDRRQTLSGKVRAYNDSWTNPIYYEV